MSGAGIDDLLAALDGFRIADGCHRCDAYTTMHVDNAGVYVLTVRHDDDCPDLARRRRAAGR